MRVDLDEAKRLSDALAFAEDKQIVDAMLAELRLLRATGEAKSICLDAIAEALDLEVPHGELYGEVNELKAKLAAAEKDAERLDFLEENVSMIRDIGWIPQTTMEYEGKRRVMKWSLRKAIDAATGKAKEGE